jgi:[ribosomal protein S18]-alanine N-acetyltransferase
MTSMPLAPDQKYVSLLWAGPDRAAEVAALHAQLFDPAWSEDSIRTSLDHPASTAFVAFDGRSRQAVGFVMGQLAADEAEIISIGVIKEWQRHGLGRRMVEGLARAIERAEAKRLFLEVAADNDAAMGLYLGLGFTATGFRRGYYQRTQGPAVDALTLALTIGQQAKPLKQ